MHLKLFGKKLTFEEKSFRFNQRSRLIIKPTLQSILYSTIKLIITSRNAKHSLIEKHKSIRLAFGCRKPDRGTCW